MVIRIKSAYHDSTYFIYSPINGPQGAYTFKKNVMIITNILNEIIAYHDSKIIIYYRSMC